MAEKRRFSTSERIAMNILAQGKCRLCGVVLELGWHGDHVVPYAKGGVTDIVNAQALCAMCNRKKGVKMQGTPIRDWPYARRDMREWQQEFYGIYFHGGKQDFTMVVTPGGGKTRAMLWVAHTLITTNVIDKVIVVCPTDNLRTQWKDEANVVGIDLYVDWDNKDGFVPSDFHGLAVTYQQVASTSGASLLFRRLVGNTWRGRVLVLFDEIHHAGDKSTWGSAIKQAFDLATRRICASGTMFRSDNAPIPFVTYDSQGNSVSDYTYGYGDSLRDGVCRYVVFPSFDGEMEWEDNTGIVMHTFQDKVSRIDEGRRITTALDSSSGWIRTVLERAHDRLLLIRSQGHPKAAGLVIAIDQAHAQRIAAILRKITGVEPVLVISEDPDAPRKLKSFKHGNQLWVVAVRMISEGIDIRRLRVGVYATNARTPLFFRQAIGRTIRMEDGIEEQTAWWFVYADAELLRFIAEIKQERNHQIELDIEKSPIGNDDDTGYFPTSYFKPQRSEAAESNVFYDGNAFTVDEVTEAQTYADRYGFPYIPHAKMAMLVRDIKALIADGMPIAVSEAVEEPQPHITPEPLLKEQSKADRMAEKRRKANKLAYRCDLVASLPPQTTHTKWLKMGNKPSRLLTEEQLDRKIAWLQEELQQVQGGVA